MENLNKIAIIATVRPENRDVKMNEFIDRVQDNAMSVIENLELNGIHTEAEKTAKKYADNVLEILCTADTLLGTRPDELVKEFILGNIK